MIGKQAGRKANKKLVNGTAFQVGRKATKLDWKWHWKSTLMSVLLLFNSHLTFRFRSFCLSIVRGWSSWISSRLRCAANCARTVVGHQSADSHWLIKPAERFLPQATWPMASRGVSTVIPRDRAGTAEAQFCCLKRGKGFPGTVFAEIEAFSSKQILLKAYFHHRLCNVWKLATSDMWSVLWHFMGQKSNKRGKYSLTALRKMLSSRDPWLKPVPLLPTDWRLLPIFPEAGSQLSHLSPCWWQPSSHLLSGPAARMES